MKHTVIVILAAGNSSRLGQNKLLVNIHGKTLIKQQCLKLLTLDLPIYCLCGYQAEEIKREISHLGIHMLYHSEWQNGLASSIAAAVNSLPSNVDQMIFMLGDQWAIDEQKLMGFVAMSKQNLEHIVTACSANPTDSLHPLTLDNVGPPVAFPKALFSSLAQLNSGNGAKSVLQSNWPLVTPFYWPEAFIDLDTPEQLNDLHSHFQEA